VNAVARDAPFKAQTTDPQPIRAKKAATEAVPMSLPMACL